jgi:hypothetical protein
MNGSSRRSPSRCAVLQGSRPSGFSYADVAPRNVSIVLAPKRRWSIDTPDAG